MAMHLILVWALAYSLEVKADVNRHLRMGAMKTTRPSWILLQRAFMRKPLPTLRRARRDRLTDQLAHGPQQLLAAQRLCERPRRACGERVPGAHDHPGVEVARERDDGDVWRGAPELRDCRCTAWPWHEHIGDDQRHRRLLEPPKCSLAVGRFANRISLRLQPVPKEITHEIVVVDDQDGDPMVLVCLRFRHVTIPRHCDYTDVPRCDARLQL